jgi:hypothetical protein
MQARARSTAHSERHIRPCSPCPAASLASKPKVHRHSTSAAKPRCMAAPLKALNMLRQYPLMGSSRPSSRHQHNKTGAKLQTRLTGVYYAEEVIRDGKSYVFGLLVSGRRLEGPPFCSGLDVHSMLHLNHSYASQLFGMMSSQQQQNRAMSRSRLTGSPGDW